MEQRPAPASSAGYRTAEIVSVLLILGGLGAVLGAGVAAGDELLGATSPESLGELLPLLAVLGLGSLALVVGLVMNAVMALVIRESLPPHRYRGPSVVVLTLLALLIANLAAIPLVGEVAALFDGGEISVTGSLLLLTITQLGLLAAAALFVAMPRALAGVRLLPERGLGRSIGLGLLLAIPAWLGAQALGVVLARLLELIGIAPVEQDAIERALEQLDPIVLAVALVVVAPIAEEIFFRGVAYNAWERERGPFRALIASALLFAAVHASLLSFEALLASLASVVPIFALGIALAILYRETRSLPAAMALHAGFNGITLVLVLLVRYDIIQLPLPT